LALVAGRGRRSDVRAAWAAIVLLLVVFVSPLCASSSALFSARVLYLAFIAAPLFAMLAGAPPPSRGFGTEFAVALIRAWR
jgi:putative membrane protein